MPHSESNDGFYTHEERISPADIPRLEPSDDIENIMVTGGNGFIGFWLLRILSALYADCYHFVSFDSQPPGAASKNTETLKPLSNVSFFEGDITSPEDVETCIRKYKIDSVIHLAALSHVADSFKKPLDFAKINVYGPLVLLAKSSSLGVRRFIFMSSGTVYGQAEPPAEGFTEALNMEPTNMYAGSKAAAEMLVTTYARNTAMKTMIVRSANVYGPNQFPEKVIPKFTLLLNRGHKLSLNGTGKHTRRYLYTTDVVNAFNAILHRGASGAAYNLGPDDEISNRALAATLVDIIRPGGSATAADVDAWIEPAPEKPSSDRGAPMDCAKLKALGWRPLVDMQKGLRQTVEWYTKHGETWWGDIEGVIGIRK